MIFFKRLHCKISSVFPLHDMRGFTLVEMMIVVGLIGIFTAMGVSTGANTNDNVLFFKDQAKIFQAIYQAREFAMATRGGACGYGIRVMNNTISIVSVPPDINTGICSSAPTVFTPEPSLASLSDLSVGITGNFTMAFLAPFGTQYLIGTNCFTIKSPKGLSTSVIKISSIGSPQIQSSPCQ